MGSAASDAYQAGVYETAPTGVRPGSVATPGHAAGTGGGRDFAEGVTMEKGRATIQVRGFRMPLCRL